jgi:predicted CXXCH cytochrome family protein
MSDREMYPCDVCHREHLSAVAVMLCEDPEDY